MASISNQPGGKRTIQFMGLDGKRRSIRLGKTSKAIAETVSAHVQAILNAAEAGIPVDPKTTIWLSQIGDDLHSRLARGGLVTPRNKSDATNATLLGPFLAIYLKRRNDAKAATRVFYGHTIRNLTAFFGDERPLASITPAEADDFRRWLTTTEQLSAATVARRCSLARTFFRDAVRRRMLEANPFEGVGGGNKSNPSRSQFVDRATIQRVIDAAPNAAWRALIALSRYGGLRCPSESLSLRWEDIHFADGRMVITSPKTAHHEGKDSRVCPLFPELRPYLEDLRELAPDGQIYILDPMRRQAARNGEWKSTNVRTTLLKIIRRAGVQPWPRITHNLRASRQTELADQFPAHVVSSWLGNTEGVARAHYLMTLDSHFERAVAEPCSALQKAVHAVSEIRSCDAHGEAGNEKTPCFQGVLAGGMGDAGLEPATSTL
jgi:integrase